MIKDDLRTARKALETAARGFDPSVCSGQDAIDLVEEIGVQRRLLDGMLGKAAKRVEDTAAHTYGTDRNAAELCERLIGVSTGEAKRAIETAGKLESLPATDAAVRAGTLSARAADLIAATAADDPAVERELLPAAAKGSSRCATRASRSALDARIRPSGRQRQRRGAVVSDVADARRDGRRATSRSPPRSAGDQAVIEDGTRKRFRDARKNGTHEPQDAYAADAFAERRFSATPSRRKGGGWTAHVVIDHEALVRGNAIDGRDV